VHEGPDLHFFSENGSRVREYPSMDLALRASEENRGILTHPVSHSLDSLRPIGYSKQTIQHWG